MRRLSPPIRRLSFLGLASYPVVLQRRRRLGLTGPCSRVAVLVLSHVGRLASIMASSFVARHSPLIGFCHILGMLENLRRILSLIWTWPVYRHFLRTLHVVMQSCTGSTLAADLDPL